MIDFVNELKQVNEEYYSYFTTQFKMKTFTQLNDVSSDYIKIFFVSSSSTKRKKPTNSDVLVVEHFY